MPSCFSIQPCTSTMSAGMLPLFSCWPLILHLKFDRYIHVCHIISCSCLPLTHIDLYDPPSGHLLHRGTSIKPFSHPHWPLIAAGTPQLLPCPQVHHSPFGHFHTRDRPGYAPCLIICHLKQSCLPTTGLYDARERPHNLSHHSIRYAPWLMIRHL